MVIIACRNKHEQNVKTQPRRHGHEPDNGRRKSVRGMRFLLKKDNRKNAHPYIFHVTKHSIDRTHNNRKTAKNMAVAKNIFNI